MSYPASVPYGESFLIVEGSSDTAHYFNPQTFTWDPLEDAALDDVANNCPAFMVDSDLFPPCKTIESQIPENKLGLVLVLVIGLAGTLAFICVLYVRAGCVDHVLHWKEKAEDEVVL